jgi:hypothetical protein
MRTVGRLEGVKILVLDLEPIAEFARPASRRQLTGNMGRFPKVGGHDFTKRDCHSSSLVDISLHDGRGLGGESCGRQPISSRDICPQPCDVALSGLWRVFGLGPHPPGWNEVNPNVSTRRSKGSPFLLLHFCDPFHPHLMGPSWIVVFLGLGGRSVFGSEPVPEVPHEFSTCLTDDSMAQVRSRALADTAKGFGGLRGGVHTNQLNGLSGNGGNS